MKVLLKRYNAYMKNEKLKVSLGEKLGEIYGSAGSLETVCCRQCGCCRVACPQMKYSEALRIVNKIWNSWTKEEKTELLAICVEYFFSRSLIKPCPMLTGSSCRVYQDRPLNCRLYGLWPNETWEKRVKKLSEQLDLEIEKIPLNVQCPYVKLSNGTPLNEKQIQSMFDALDSLDRVILSEGKTEGNAYKKAIGMTRNNWNYRTIHDWILFFFWGEERLAQMTDIAIIANEEQLTDMIGNFRKIVSSGDFSLELPGGV